MPKTITNQLKEHLAQEITTLAVLWRIVRRDGVVLGFTNHIRDLTFDSQLYQSNIGMTPSGIASSSDMTVDNLEISAILSRSAISENDIRSGLLDHCEVLVFVVNYEDLSMGRLILKRGYTGQVRIRSNGTFACDFRSLSEAYSQKIVALTQPLCRVKRLGDPICKVNLNGNTVGGDPITQNGWVSEVVSNHQFRSNLTSSAAPPFVEAGLYQWNTVTFDRLDIYQLYILWTAEQNRPSGERQNIIVPPPSSVITAFDGTTFRLALDPFNEIDPDDDHFIKAGDTGTIYFQRLSDSAFLSRAFTVDKARMDAGTPTFQVNNGFWADSVPSSGDSFPNGHFSRGTVHFLSGPNMNLGFEVQSFESGLFTLQTQTPFPMSEGDTFVAVAGCDRRIETCSAKFANAVNFDGEPYVPGVENVLRVVTA